MDINEKLKHGVLKALQSASPETGMKLSDAIKEAGYKKPNRKTKDMVRKFLNIYALQYPKQLYYLSEGEKVYPAEEGDAPMRGKSVGWKLQGPPKLLRKDTQALALALSQRFSRYLLPPDERKFINVLYEKRLKEHSAENKWLKQVDIIPRYPPLYPNYEEHTYSFTEQVILNALKQEQGFNGKYLGNESTFYPVKLVRREWVSYVICTEDPDLSTYKEYAIHRFSVTKANHPDDVELVSIPIGSRLDYKNPEKESGVKGNWGLLKKLVITVTGAPAQHISEMRFHESQNQKKLTQILSSEPEGGSRLTSVTIEIKQLPYNYELKTWLLGLGSHVQVVEAIPADQNSHFDLKADLRNEIERMHSLYK